MPSDKLKMLFLCTGNSCRSQMAEGFARARFGSQYEVYSAGVEARGVDPRAVKVMAEAGVDISRQDSSTIDSISGLDFDYVITVCAHADERCPVFPGAGRRIHRGFDDPPKLASALDDEREILDCYRRVREELRAFVESLPAD